MTIAPGSQPQEFPTHQSTPPQPPAHQPTAPQSAPRSSSGAGEHLSPAQHWARWTAAREGTATTVLPTPSAGAGGPGTPAGPPPVQDPWAAPPAPQRRRSRAWGWVAGAAVAGLLVGGGAVAGASALAGAADGSSARPASLAEIGRTSGDGVPVSGSTSADPDWQKVAAAVQDSVVAIEVTTQQGGSQGSGVIVDDSGHVVTNDHVVSGADGSVTVTLTDGRMLEATVVGADASTDLAVLEITDAPDDLTPASLGDSDDVTVGEPVMAVGNPLGLANTVTTGIVSAVDRPVSTQAQGSEAAVTNAIQVDAAINPGNSGGPLFDASGRVIGITSSIATLSQESGSIGLGFAIPVNVVKNVAAQLVDDGQAEHAFLGVTLSDGTASADGVTRRGAVVESVTDGSPAAKAGVRTGDVVVAVDKDPVGGAESLTAFVRSLAAGDDVTLTVVRDGKAVELDVTLATRPDDADQQGQNQGQDQQGRGQQGQGQQGQGQQGQDGDSTMPGGVSPDQLWEWLQQQRG